MTDLFLSYKAEDRGRVAPLVEALEADGYSVWWDADLVGGEQWREKILHHLDRARCVIVAWSKRSVGPEGHFVRDEATRALRRGVYLPVRIDSVDPPLGFGETQALNLVGWKGDPSDARYRGVLRAVEARLGGDTGPNLPRAGKIDRRGALAGGGAAVLAAAGVGGWMFVKRADQASNSIAVLPFANLSGDPAQAYFSDGMAEELRSALARIAGLHVAARTSSEAVRDADAKTAARRLEVGNVLTGSVRRSSEVIRVTAQLIDGRKGFERWSQIYDRPAGDVLQIQTDIASKVAEALSVHLGSGERSRLTEGGTSNATAQDLVLKARDLVAHDDTEAGLERAAGLVDAAIALDPKYADAFAAKSLILKFLAGQSARTGAEMRAGFASAEEAARRSVELAPKSAKAHSALAGALYSQLRIRQALAEFALMDSLPGAAHGEFDNLESYTWALANVGQTDRALKRIETILEQDPLNPSAYVTKAAVLGFGHRYRDALRVSERAVALAPTLTWPRAFRGLFLMQLGELEASKGEFAIIREPGPWQAWEAILAERRGDRAESNRLIRSMQESMGDSGHFQYAEVYAQQGRRDEAIAALESAWQANDTGLTAIKVDPMLDPLRSDPRFSAVVRKLDFPN